MANEEKKDEELEGTVKGVEVPEDEGLEPETAVAPTVADEADDEEAEDELADDEDSDEEDDDSEDEGEEDDDSEDELAAAPVTKATARASDRRRKKKTGRKKRAPQTTAGQRLAAAKAAKAARKAAQRGKEAEIVEDEAIEQAEVAGRWLEENRNKIFMAMAAVVLIAAGIFAFGKLAKAGDTDAAAALWEAMEIQTARVVPEDEEGEDTTDDSADEDEQTFPTVQARAEAAIPAFEAVVRDHSGTRAAAFASIAIGNAKRLLGDPAAAREAYESALAASDDTEVAMHALEGIGFSFEEEESWDEAKARFEEMGDVEREGAEILADFHLARLAMAQGERERAKEQLQAVLEALDEEDAPEMEFVRDQAEMRLREIDPSLVQSSAPSIPNLGGGLGGEGMTPEMQRMLQELMNKQQQGQ
ncbi:MAG: hypothetical protein CMN30_26610 [Sandaracinus sp.]|nr:hypothetical protein [Sandaracinus sp.]